MILLTILSSFCLLTTPPTVEPNDDPAVEHSLEIVKNHSLETADGRIAFLSNELSPFVARADALNQEIQELSNQIHDLDSEKNKEQMVMLGEELTQKMGSMMELLPALQTALRIDADFQQIDAILSKQEPLDPSEKELLDRIAALCTCVDEHPL